MFLFASFASCVLVERHEELSFLSWMREHGQMYVGDEYAFRLGVFLSRSRYIREFNRGNTFQLAHNRFSCMTNDEYKVLLSSGRKSKRPADAKYFKSTKKDWPAEFDWRTKVEVNPVRDQQNCAAGYAFAPCAAQETSWNINYKQNYVLSPQMILDCDDLDQGCAGGEADRVVGWICILKGGKWMLESDYPYTGVVGSCKLDQNNTYTKTYHCVYATDETIMVHAVNELGPVVCGFDASQTDFMQYKSGIYYNDKCDPWTVNHWMTIVGYGVQNGNDYWIVKNSFGKSWGMDGYVNIARNKGTCAIDYNSFAIDVLDD